MNDECQPDYCDCEGFHTGACRQRKLERDTFNSAEWQAALKITLGCSPYDLPRRTCTNLVIDTTSFPDQMGPMITSFQFDK